MPNYVGETVTIRFRTPEAVGRHASASVIHGESGESRQASIYSREVEDGLLVWTLRFTPNLRGRWDVGIVFFDGGIKEFPVTVQSRKAQV